MKDKENLQVDKREGHARQCGDGKYVHETVRDGKALGDGIE